MGGEASYSLYLLHYWVMHDLGHRLADNRPVLIRPGCRWSSCLFPSALPGSQYLTFFPAPDDPHRALAVFGASARLAHDETSYVEPAVAVQPVVVPPKEWGINWSAARWGSLIRTAPRNDIHNGK